VPSPGRVVRNYLPSRYCSVFAVETLDGALRWRDEAESTTATVWEVEAADDAFAGMLMLERSGELGARVHVGRLGGNVNTTRGRARR